MPAQLQTDSEIAQPITCIISDVDGVLTDGRIIYDSQGHETKQFSVRDGLGMKLWMRSGYQLAILTARNSAIVAKRAEELGIEHCHQGFEKKLPEAEKIMAEFRLKASQVCYIGDDLPDIPVMRRVGLAVAPADAATDARDAAHWILRSVGGQGAFRELVEKLLRAKQQWEEHVPE